jgi:hypothetical protein
MRIAYHRYLDVERAYRHFEVTRCRTTIKRKHSRLHGHVKTVGKHIAVSEDVGTGP